MDIAYEEIGGAGSAITNLLDPWFTEPVAGDPTRDDYAALNQGQLKMIGSLFYDRLAQVGYLGRPTFGNGYPWSPGTGDDQPYATVNLGQLKYVFSFSIINPALDSDSDSLPDEWELEWFPNLTTANAQSDYDQDGVLDLDEYLRGRRPIPDPSGGGNEASLPPPTLLTYEYDDAGRLQTVTWNSATSPSASYPLDEEGNVGVTLP